MSIRKATSVNTCRSHIAPICQSQVKRTQKKGPAHFFSGDVSYCFLEILSAEGLSTSSGCTQKMRSKSTDCTCTESIFLTVQRRAARGGSGSTKNWCALCNRIGAPVGWRIQLIGISAGKGKDQRNLPNLQHTSARETSILEVELAEVEGI